MRYEESPQSLAPIEPEPPEASALSTLTCREWVAVLDLRRRYRDGGDLWDSRELARLRWLRWLRNTGQLPS